MISHGSIDVKSVLFNDKKTSFSKIQVAFNNADICILGLPNRSSAGDMYVYYNKRNFEAIVRRNMLNLVQRLKHCTSSIIKVLVHKIGGLETLVIACY